MYYEGNIINEIFYYSAIFAVPTFFAIDGFFILNKEKISFMYCLKKYLVF